MPSPFDDIFGGSGPQWTWEQMQARLDAGIARERLPRDLVYALVKQESNWDPYAKGDGGKALGFFQLHPGAATDAGIEPAHRGDIGLNIDAGTRYFRLKLDQAQGDEDRALRLYNGGGDPNYVANVRRHMPAHREQPTLLTRAASILSPASAEAQAPQQAPPPAVWDDIFGAQPPPGATSTPAPGSQPPPTATPQPGASQGPSVPSPADAQHAAATLAALRQRQTEGATPEARLQRFQQLPAITALSPEARQAAVAEFQAMNEAQQRAFLASEPAADLPMAMQEGPRLTPEQQLRPQGFVPTEAPVTEGITKPSTMIPLLMGLHPGLRAVPEAIQQGGIWAERAARPIIQGLGQTLGWGTGKTIEEGQVPSAGEVAKEVVLNIGTGAAVEVPGAIKQAWQGLLRTTLGGQKLLNQQSVKTAEDLGQRIFQAEDKAVVSQIFDDVATSGVKLDVAPVRDLWKGFSVEERRIATNELKKISPAFAQALDNPRLKGWDIGDLQHLRSELLKAYKARQTPATKDLLMAMRSSVDDAIHDGIAVGRQAAGTVPETLQQAQDAWRRVQQAENLQGLVGKHTRKSGPGLEFAEINFSALEKDLRGDGTRAAQRLVAQMSPTERAYLAQELKELSRHVPFGRFGEYGTRITEWGSLLSAAGQLLTGNVPLAMASLFPLILTSAARSPRVMGVFKQSILEGKGQLSRHHVDTILNAIRHEQEGTSGTGG